VRQPHTTELDVAVSDRESSIANRDVACGSRSTSVANAPPALSRMRPERNGGWPSGLLSVTPYPVQSSGAPVRSRPPIVGVVVVTLGS
jgi:hypothetical protein